MALRLKQRSVLPGFGLTMGFTLLYLCLLVLIPFAVLVVRSSTMSWDQFWRTVTEPQVVAAYKLSLGASLLAATINAVFGFIVAWVLVRYPFPGKKLIDALVDIPFALPTAVSGIALATVYGANGWIGRWLEPMGIQVAYSRLGIIVALTFIGLPFVVRTLQPALEDLDPEIEEAAASLGAGRLHTFFRVVLPVILPALLTGFALALARAIGEYGSVIFISSNIPMETQIVPQLIYTKLVQFDYAGAPYAEATAIGLVMLMVSFVLLFAINVLQWWSRRYAVS